MRDDSGRIVGARLDTESGPLQVTARRGVILACGGFSSSPEMQKQFFGMEMPSFGPPGQHMGDGVKMAQDIGADLWHMNAAAAVFGYMVPGRRRPGSIGCPRPFTSMWTITASDLWTRLEWTITRWARCCSEFDPLEASIHVSPVTSCSTKQRVSLDRFATFAAATIGVSGGARITPRKLSEAGIQRADTVAELAGKIGLDGSVLNATVERYNSNCRAGIDADFGREDGLQALDTSLYYVDQGGAVPAEHPGWPTSRCPLAHPRRIR